MVVETPHLSGSVLRGRRAESRVSVHDLAMAMGVSPQRVSNIEGEERPTAAAIRRYIWALNQVVLER
jgi:transcriptional regulator with XRE-family HTH domain